MTTADTLDPIPTNITTTTSSPTPKTDSIILSDAPDATIPIDAIDLSKTDDHYTVNDISISQEETRAKIAWTFTCFFLVVIILALTFPFIANIFIPKYFADPIEAAKSLLTVLASILAGPFGFIVGFYFKQNTNNN